jgi:DNA-binding MarR family transcriptional regulator
MPSTPWPSPAARRSGEDGEVGEVGEDGEDREDGGWRPRAGSDTSILFDVFALGQQVRTLLHAAMRDAGMRPDDYAVYSVLFEAGPVTLTEAASRLGMPVTTAADYVRAIHARGHLSKERHPSDSRAFLLTLTRAGTGAHRRASACFERAYRAVVRELPPLDEAHARAVLRQLAGSAARATAALGQDPSRRR